MAFGPGSVSALRPVPAPTLCFALVLIVGSASFAEAEAAESAVEAGVVSAPADVGAEARFVARVEAPDGSPVLDAVVGLIPLDERSPPPLRSAAPLRATMDQVDLAFVPHVLAVEVGTVVDFPNSDQVRHSIYSFSSARTFEIKLYRGFEAPPIPFDRAGLVVLGCNIHDHMLGFIYVLETPWFATSDETGRVAIAGAPPGRYRLELRHPRLEESLVVAREIALPAERGTTLVLPAKPPPRPALRPAPDPLQDLFGARGR
ncbi:MAG: methylamine utilization protein [Myxococcota bacterium]